MFALARFMRQSLSCLDFFAYFTVQKHAACTAAFSCLPRIIIAETPPSGFKVTLVRRGRTGSPRGQIGKKYKKLLRVEEENFPERKELSARDSIGSDAAFLSPY